MKNLKSPKPVKGNDKPEMLYSLKINVYSDGTSHMIPDRDGIAWSNIRLQLMTHLELVRERLIIHAVQQEQNKVKILKPNQMNIPMKLRQ